MTMARKRRPPTVDERIDRSAKRAEQKAAGMFDGRYRLRVVRSGKVYKRRPKHRGDQE